MANVKKPTASKPKRAARKSTPARRSAERQATAIADTSAPSGAWRQLLSSLLMIKRHWRYFVIFLLLYGILNLLLAHNLASGVTTTKANLENLLGNSAWASVGTYTLLLTSSASGSSSSAAAYQYMLFVVGSLALIWALRQFSAKEPKNVRVRESFYEGMAPLVPFILTLIVITIELTPLAVAGGLYAIVISNSVVTTAFEQILWLGISLVGAGVTLWLLARSVFALYIVTLPGSRPVGSLKDSFRVTKPYQWAIVRKLVLLVAAILLIGAGIMVPVIAFVPGLTAAILFIFSIALVPFVHAYCYGMYRETI
jgi:hypothetical protein